MLICILTKNVITSCSVMMLFLHLEVKPLMTLITVLYLSCALISGHLAMMLMELTKQIGRAVRRNAETDLVCRLLLEKKKTKRGKEHYHQQDYPINRTMPRDIVSPPAHLN